MYGKSSRPADKRSEFYNLLIDSDLHNAMKKLMPVTINDKLRVAIKKIMIARKRIG